MHRITQILSVVILCGILQISLAQSDCNKCLPNRAYCVDDSSYYMCLNDKDPSRTRLYSCKTDEVCTSTTKICEPKTGNVAAACSGSCSKCPDPTKRFTCVSKTHFGVCIDGAVAFDGSCDAGEICSSELYDKTGDICAPQCVVDFYGVAPTCVNDIPATITTTTTTSAPVDTAKLKLACKTADTGNNLTLDYFYIKNADDTDCRTYIYCERFGPDHEAYLIRCATGYIDLSTMNCVNTKPPNC